MTPETLCALALALPQAEESPHFDRRSFRVRGKIFATLGGEWLHVFVDDVDADAAVAADPAGVTVLWWGPKRAGVRLSLEGAEEGVVRDLLTQSWRRKAPRKLAERFVDASGRSP